MLINVVQISTCVRLLITDDKLNNGENVYCIEQNNVKQSAYFWSDIFLLGYVLMLGA